jgi:hypothetical protein
MLNALAERDSDSNNNVNLIFEFRGGSSGLEYSYCKL